MIRRDKVNLVKAAAILMCMGLSFSISGCAQGSGDGDMSQVESTLDEPGSEKETVTETETETETEAPEPGSFFIETDKKVFFNYSAGFYDKSIQLAMQSADGKGIIHFTTDGSTPTKDSQVYEKPVELTANSSSFPRVYCIRAAVEYENGKMSEVTANTYFLNTGIDTRYTTYVFSVSGEPSELTEGPDGIFYGDNYKNRGRESEREAYIEAFTADGKQLLGQFAGVRIFGGVSRESSIKSMKLYARKSYDKDHGKFRISVFDTIDVNGELIDKYDKLVLRNCGNDFQFAYIRDELNQTLAMKAGFTDYEGVVPAVGYLNGKYYGFYWLHESYCDDYFKEKYGDGPGEFVIVEGNEQDKWASGGDDDTYAKEYQELYDTVSELDMTDDDNYKLVTDSIDVENYLDYYAFNIYISNNDWPQNNYKCYRYEFADGEEQGEGRFDGRWRYLLHDVDYSLGLYDQRETRATYDMLSQVLDKKSNRYSPLFASLMERDECKEYFANKLIELMNGPLSEEGILSTLDELAEKRDQEMVYYYKHIEKLRDAGDETMWSWEGHLEGYVQLIKDFAADRARIMSKHILRNLSIDVELDEDTGLYVIEEPIQKDEEE